LGRLAYAEAHDLVRLRIGDVAAVEHDAAAGRVHEAGDRAQRRGLPRAVGADERDDLARRNGERHAAQGLHAAVEDVDPTHLEERCRRRRRGRHQCCFPRYASMTRWSLRTCSGVPSAIFSPWSRTTMRRDTPMTTFMSCSMRKTVTPLSTILCTRPMSSTFSCGVKPAAGSSRRMRAGLGASARAISRRRCEPYGRFRAYVWV